MRSGRLLAEESPQSLLNSHNLTSLEDVFLKLCMKDVTSSPPSTPSTVPTSVASTPIVTDKPQRRIQQEFDNGQNNPVFEQQTEEINGNEQVMNANNWFRVIILSYEKKKNDLQNSWMPAASPLFRLRRRMAFSTKRILLSFRVPTGQTFFNSK